MARAWITDRWTKAAIIDGHKVQPPAAQLRKLSTLEDKFKTDRFQQGKRWRVSWYETKDGRKRLRSESFDSKSAAEARRAALEDDIRSGRYIDPAKAGTLFSEAADAWIASKLSQSDSTIKRYKRELRAYVKPRWGKVRLDGITEDAINEWVTQLIDGTAPVAFLDTERKAQKLAPASVHHIVRNVFGAVLKYAVRRRWIATNPLDDIGTPRVEKHAHVYLTFQEVEALATSAESVRTHSGTLVRLLAYCGPRINEALALRCEDVDLPNRRLSIRRTRHRNGTEGPTKGHAHRKVAIPAGIVPEIQKLIHGDPDAYLFPAPKGGAETDVNWRNRVWYSAVAGAGLDIPGLDIHALRHTYASLAISAGADVVTLQHSMGHKDATVTLNTYAGLWPERLGEVADKLDASRIAALQSCPNHARGADRDSFKKQTPQ